MRKIIFTSEQTEQIIDLYVNEMLSMAKIGERFGVSKNVIRRISYGFFVPPHLM